MSFIVFEGGEGTGKSSHARALFGRLSSLGFDVVLTREPGGTPAAEQIRSMLVASNSNLNAMTNTLLFAAARSEHVEKVIRPALSAGKIVISDRYVLSTIAYQGAGEGIAPDFIANLHNATTNGLHPSLTIILDVDPRIGLPRSMRRLDDESSNESRFEGFDLGFHDRMRKSMLENCTSHHIVIDASQTIEEVAKDVMDAVMAHLQG
jgi:dTMP kinase